MWVGQGILEESVRDTLKEPNSDATVGAFPTLNHVPARENQSQLVCACNCEKELTISRQKQIALHEKYKTVLAAKEAAIDEKELDLIHLKHTRIRSDSTRTEMA